jgi:glycosyltransferase involved in cell wall biosynthesis
VDTGLYRPGGDGVWLRREFGLPAAAKVVGMAAQFIPRKGHHLLLDAVPAVLAAHPEAHFLLFGQGPLQAAIRSRVEREELSGAVQLPGFRDDLARILPTLDLLVHPAAMEGLGVALLQAAACGVPIVAGRAGGIPEVVRHGENGWLVDPADGEDLARRINTLLENPDQAAAFGAAGRRLVEREFSIPAMGRDNLAIYHQAIAGGT